MSAQEIRVEQLTVSIGKRDILHDINLSVMADRAMALTGPSGSGKSVLLHTLGGLIPPTLGRVLVDGESIRRGEAEASVSIGLILQSHGLASGLTSEENVALPLLEQDLTRAEIASRTARALEDVGLERAANQLVDELSGGQRQRVGIARALAGHPDVLLADEPTSELDPANRSRVLTLLLHSQTHRIVLVASNDPEVIDACSEVVHLRDGRILTPDSLSER